jgi:hypothetical protein
MKVFVSIIFFLSCLLPAASAATVGGVEVSDQFGELQLRGAGLLKKGLFFKVYIGAFYTHSNGTRRLDIHYLRSTPKKRMIQIAEETLQKNLTGEEYERHLPNLEKLHRALLAGKKGSVASITIVPGRGLTYSFDDQPVIMLPDSEFAEDYLKIWLGKNPSSRSMKNALLNRDDK